LSIFDEKVDLIVIPPAAVNLNQFFPEEKHHLERIVQLVEIVVVRHFVDVNKIYYCEITYVKCDLVEQLVEQHSPGIGFNPEPQNHNPILLRQDRLVNLPAGIQMWEHIRHFSKSYFFTEDYIP
jgi:hypothetical protein